MKWHMSECCKESRKYEGKVIILTTERQIDPFLHFVTWRYPGHYNRRKDYKIQCIYSITKNQLILICCNQG